MKTLSLGNFILALSLLSRLRRMPLWKVAAILLRDVRKQQLVLLAMSRKAIVLDYFAAPHPPAETDL
jgi:hypothetical protein